MVCLLREIRKLQNSDVGKLVKSRLKEFKQNDHFSELCFCILTANSRARTAIRIQDTLGKAGFEKASLDEIRNCIRENKHRFHNNKARYIVEARKCNIKLDRGWLVENVKGLGYKEASHFLRNIGYEDYAILDRHILRLMKEHGYIEEVPKSLTGKKYLEIEQVFKRIAKRLNMSAAELDMYMWYMKTGEVLK